MRSSVVVLPLMIAIGLLGGCASKLPCPPGTVSSTAGPTPPDWHDIVSDPDHVRLRDWRRSLVTALAAARHEGYGAEIDAAGPLLDPDTALDNVTLPEGAYRCQTYKLGSRVAGRTSYTVDPAHDCVIRPSDTIERLSQSDGPQRPTGRLYPDTSSRMIFLGVMVLTDESAPIKYGRDPDRDIVGAVQRVGDKRWRMLIPQPAWESTIDVMEITPAQ